MRTKLATIALAGALGITGATGAVLAAPALSYAATGDATALDDRVSSLREALAGLVSDGTITSSQADRVATTLAERGPLGHHGHRGGPAGGREALSAAAEALGLTEDELRTAAREGATLTELADREGVETSAVVDAVVAAAEASLAERVAEGDLTRAEADARADELEARTSASVDEPLRLGRGSRGGPGRHAHRPAGDEVTPAPSGSAEPDDA